MLSHAARLIGELVFPARCIGCGIRGTALCAGCRAELPYLPDGVCSRCAGALGPRGVCSGCRRLSPTLSGVRAAFAYRGAARTAVLTLKFKSGRYLVPTMGELLRHELGIRPVQADVLVPVPLSARRLRQRGFNQALLLAQEIAATGHATIAADALARQDRSAQRTLTSAERRVNLRGSIICQRPAEIHGQRVLVVDDVVTTGATLSACADALAAAGARRVSGLAFARDL